MKLDRKGVMIIVGGLLMVAIIAVPSPKRKAEPSAQPAAADAAPSEEVAWVAEPIWLGEEVLAQQRDRARELAWGPDPFYSVPVVLEPEPIFVPEPLVEEIPIGPLPQLFGVISSGAGRRALIDHSIVQEGDQLASGFTVQKIGSETVRLIRHGQRLTISLENQ